MLNQYKKELLIMEKLFEDGREGFKTGKEEGTDNPPISKNMPRDAGRIAWARSIMGRIKAPIRKFKTKAE